MALEDDASGRDRLTRMLAAAGLTVAAAALLRRGRRITGGLAGVGALALGYQVATESEELTESITPTTLSTEPEAAETDAHTGGLECAICGEPIVPGQARGPDENDDIVHIDCREASIEVTD